MGFAGLRILYPLNKPGDELGAFLGVSYFRFLCQQAVLRALGPRPRDQHGRARRRGVPGLPRVLGREAGAGREDAHRVRPPRRPDRGRGLPVPDHARRRDGHAGPRGHLLPAQPRRPRARAAHEHVLARQEHRRELRRLPARGARLRRADGQHRRGRVDLAARSPTPTATRVAAFSDENPRGFGLIQRERKFENYQDLEAYYHLRPSAWVEPVGPVGQGRGAPGRAPRPGRDRTTTSRPSGCPTPLPRPGEPIELTYKLHWFMDQIHPPAGYVVGTRHGPHGDPGDGPRALRRRL